MKTTYVIVQTIIYVAIAKAKNVRIFFIFQRKIKGELFMFTNLAHPFGIFFPFTCGLYHVHLSFSLDRITPYIVTELHSTDAGKEPNMKGK